jgi:Flp pilus assembly protein TadG
MILSLSTKRRRLGSAVVQTAAVAGVFLLVFMGVVEYCRFLFFLQISENACREGCRYAVVNTSDATLTADTQAVVNKYMNNLGTAMQNFTITVFDCDSSGTNLGGPGNAQFGQQICVQIDYDYVTMAPSLMFLTNTVHVTTKSYMCSEAN